MMIERSQIPPKEHTAWLHLYKTRKCKIISSDRKQRSECLDYQEEGGNVTGTHKCPNL